MPSSHNLPRPLFSDALLAQKSVAHGFFTRQGGVSDGLYDSLNGGLGSADVPTNILENRARVATALEILPAHLLTVHQHHSALVETVEQPWPTDEAPKADAMVTAAPGLGLAILTADCGPVLFSDSVAGVVGAAHAGWKGAFSGVLEATVRAMQALGATPGNITAAVGPCIGPVSYEVGPEFKERFLKCAPENAGFFVESAKPAHHFFNLPGYIRRQLSALALGNITDLACDTYADPSLFFSYRRSCHSNEEDYGRLMSVITLRSTLNSR